MQEKVCRDRSGNFETRGSDPKSREVPVTVSTESPVERGDYVEVLDHAPGAVDLSRAPLPLIESHDQRRVNVGVVHSLQIDGGRLRGIARFGRSARAEELYRDIVDDIVTGVSVGYELLDRGTPMGDRTKKFKFKPFEVSVVAVPADIRAGFKRSKVNKMSDIKIIEDNEIPGARDRSKDLNPEAERVTRIVGLARAYSQYVGTEDIAKACQDQWSVDRFQNHIMRNMESGHTDTSVSVTSGKALTPTERDRYNLRNVILQSIDPVKYGRLTGFERECSDAITREYGGRAPAGIYVPDFVFGSPVGRRDFSIAANGGSGLVETSVMGNLMTEYLRPMPAVEMAGATVLNGLTANVTIPRISAGASLTMVAEQGTATETDVTQTGVALSPKRVTGYVDLSKQLIIQSALAAENLIRMDLGNAFAAMLDSQAINGVGTGNEMRGLRYTTGIGTSTAGANGAAPTWTHVVDLESQALIANAAQRRPGYLINAKARKALKTTPKGTNLDMIIQDNISLNGAPYFVANNLPSNLTKGTSTTICSAGLYSSDWAMAVIALFGGHDITVDPYTFATTGTVRITLNQFADFGNRQPACFTKIEDWLAS